MSNVSKNLSAIRERIKVACLKRPPEINNFVPRLVAVSKTKPKELILEAYKEGQLHFGENYVQEIVAKSRDEDIISQCPNIKWHYIGHLQRNKINKIITVPNLYVIETVDTDKLACALNSALEKSCDNKKLNIFVQVNTSGEKEKSGCNPEEVVTLVNYIVKKCPNLNVLGLMTIGKYDNYNSAEKINPDFQCLINCRLKVCNELGIDVDKFELSMGMSADFEHAIEVGSTNVRIGSSIFGSRN